MGIIKKCFNFVFKSGLEEVFWSSVKAVFWSKMSGGVMASIVLGRLAWLANLPGWAIFLLVISGFLIAVWAINGILWGLLQWYKHKKPDRSEQLNSIKQNTESKHDPPEPQFGCPLQLAGEDHLSWWHIPIWLEKKGESSIPTAYEHCRARVVSLVGPFLQVSQLDLRCQSDDPVGDKEFPLRLGEDHKVIPIAIRSEIVDQETMACLAYFTDEGYLQHGIRAPRLESGKYQFRVEIQHETLHWESGVYILSIPGPRMSNGHFIMQSAELHQRILLVTEPELMRRREQIAKWRKMVNEIIRELDLTGKFGDQHRMYLLERHPDFASLAPLLSQEARRQIHRNTEFLVGTTIDHGLAHLRNDISRIEKEWGL